MPARDKNDGKKSPATTTCESCKIMTGLYNTTYARVHDLCTTIQYTEKNEIKTEAEGNRENFQVTKRKTKKSRTIIKALS